MKTVIKWGLIIGVVLGISAYGYLWYIDRQLRAQEHANTIERQTREYTEFKRRDMSYSQPSLENLDASAMWNGEHYALQPVYGYRALQQPYNPQLMGLER